MPPVALTYEGTVIHQRQQMLSLTDMWRAAGSPENQEPFNWTRKEGAAFIEAVSLAHNLTEGQVIVAKPGKGGGTMAHWQIAFAYAKYLSPDFHMWCNTVVRERMEGHRRPDALTASEVGGIIKAVSNRSLADHLHPLITELRMVLAGFDPAQTIVADYQPMLAVLVEQGIGPRRRRQLSQRCSNRCKRWLISQGRGDEIKLSRETKRYLFQTGATQEWLRAEGFGLIEAHRQMLAGQTIMQFKPGPKLVPPTSAQDIVS